MAWKKELGIIRECSLGRECHLWVEEAVMAVEGVSIASETYFDLETALLQRAVAAGLRGPNLLGW